MDFNLDEELLAVQELAREIFGDRATTERVREVESTETRIDDALWKALADAGLLGIALPEEHGGAGLGLDAVCVVLEEQGRHVAPVPLWSAAVAARAVAAFGAGEQQAVLLPGAADGSQRIALALEEYDGAAPSAPRTRATSGADGWRLTGTKAVVPSPTGAGHVLVSATTGEGAGLFLVPADGPGVAWEQVETTSQDLAGNLVLADAAATPVGAQDGEPLASVLREATLALAACQLGVADGAMRLAAGYVSEREQFGRPLGTFQAVQHKLADSWIEVDALRLTLWQALSDLTSGEHPDRSVLVVKWWAAQGGLDGVHRAQHVHGGIGVDVDYPMHRYLLWAKQLSNTLEGPAATLARLGSQLSGRSGRAIMRAETIGAHA